MHYDPIIKALNPMPCNPMIVLQTYVDKPKIPAYVAEAWQTFAPEYERHVFDDDEMKKFMVTYFQPLVVKRFDELPFPHKADLWRYCALYIYGGLYADIKTELTRPIREVITQPDCMYVVDGAFKGNGYYNGFMYTPIKENPIIYDLIKFIVDTPLQNYHDYTNHLESLLATKYCKNRHCQLGYNETLGNVPPVIVLKETNQNDHEICKGTLDRYNYCVFMIDDKGDIQFKTRYHSYPWH